MTDTIAELRELLGKATAGPWQAVSRQIPWSLENGKTGSHTDWRIGTSWDHPQLKAPAPVVTISVGLGNEGGPPVHLVHISAEDAALIVAMRNNIEALLDRVEAAEWRPIETAPKDGETVLLFNSDERLVDCGFFCTWVGDDRPGHWEVTGSNHWYQGDVTHWRPLPDAPQQKADTP